MTTTGIAWFSRTGGRFISYGTDAEVRATASDICWFATGKGERIDIQPLIEQVGLFSYLLVDADGTPLKVWR